ncbi:uncharacterized protein LOC117211912 [Bombus bifarius]|uniref:Uncharacterized protein LOC117211912 n=1 Tax=Bombus bifarius TaxID=103933 RepID=A0A6P8MUM0_9HYME|nr:uncharacterized protein LOC117166004 [Bombus vancouverensis nearcticus]XP_033312123.1 uncharacterized protein LOC117211912 [Bombus bifarius]
MIRQIESPLTGNFMASNVNYRRGISCNLNDIMDSKELSRRTKVHGQTPKTLRIVTNAPWYISNQTLHERLKIPSIEHVIGLDAVKYENRNTSHGEGIPVLRMQEDDTFGCCARFH